MNQKQQTNYHRTHLIGEVKGQPEYVQTKGGYDLLKFCIGVTETSGKGEKKEFTENYFCSMWGEDARLWMDSLKEGMLVRAELKRQTSSYLEGDKRRYSSNYVVVDIMNLDAERDYTTLGNDFNEFLRETPGFGLKTA